jgi:very-short-patch-repair endonuclease
LWFGQFGQILSTVRARSLPDFTLRRVPFTVAQAREAGMRWRDLQTRHWSRTSHGQYAWAGLPQDFRLKLLAVSLRMPRKYAFSGLAAAWLLGLDSSWSELVEVTVPRDVPVRARAGVKVRRAALPESDVIVKRGLRTTSAMRTVCDLGSRADLVESVVAVDMALYAGLVKLPDLESHVATHAGAKGIRRLRRAVWLAEPRSESPMETRLRIQLIRGRLPRPSVQSELCDSNGRFLGRVDLYYPDRRLAIEYDGAGHKDHLDADLKRQNALLNAGYHLLRFTAADLRQPKSVVAEVRKVRATLPVIRDSPD